MDPGAFALIGAGAFMGGVTRLTISVTVIMMEACARSDLYTRLPVISFNQIFQQICCLAVAALF